MIQSTISYPSTTVLRRIVRWTGVVLIAACAACTTSGAAGGGDRAPDVAAVDLDRTQGGASYYADKFNGRPTASGEPYDPRAMTAAHRTLPFGTRLRVTRLDTGASVVVRVNDRGPFKRARIIDLSKAAARNLDMIRDGVVDVRIELHDGSRTTDADPVPTAPTDDRTSTSW